MLEMTVSYTESYAADGIWHPVLRFLRPQEAGCKAFRKVLIYCQEPITKAMPARPLAPIAFT